MLYIIANETAGSGAGAAVFSRVCDMLKEKGIPFRADRTEGPGHAVRLADEAVRTGETDIVCLGGDGTLSEVAAGMMRLKENLRRPIGYIPLGTTNDVATSLGLPKNNTQRAALRILNGTPTKRRAIC